MWGRLDASVRVVDMLVDAKRAEWVSGHTDVDPAGVLADALWPADEPAAGSADANLARAQRRLIAEVLTEAEPVEPSEAFREGEWRREQLRERLELSHAALHEELRRAIADDPAKAAGRDAPPPALTRALCVRAAQLEVLCHEYGNVVATSVTDLETGTAAKPLEPVAASWEDTIEQLRTGSSLPRRLGARDDAERSSTLMIRTTTRSALVALAAMRATKLPLSRALNFPGTLLLPAAGIVARKREWALAVALAFWVIALFVAGRVLSVSHGGDASDVLSVVVTYLGVAGLLSACVVPVWRMRRGMGGMHLLSQGLWLVALLATGLGAVVAAGVGDASWGEVALQRGADPPPWYLLVFAAASFGFVRWLPKPLRRIVQRDTERWRGALSLWRLVPWAAVAVWAGGWPLRHELLEGRHGLPPAAGFALIAAPLIVATAYVLLSGRRLPARWRGPVAAVGERAAAWFRAKRPRRGRHPSGVAAPDGA
jgi:hypothetical protein